MRNSTFLLFIALTLAPTAQAASAYGARMGSKGIVSCGGTVSYRPDDGIGGINETRRDCKVVESTNSVRARVGLTMGCEYELLGHPQGDKVNVVIRTTIPRPGIKSLTSGANVLETNTPFQQSIGKNQWMMWSFDRIGEIVPGRWTQELRYEGTTLGSCSYDVSN